MALHIADHQPDMALGQRDNVIEVTANLCSTVTGHITDGNGDLRVLVDILRKKAALEVPCDRGLFVECPGTTDGSGDLGGKILGKPELFAPDSPT